MSTTSQYLTNAGGTITLNMFRAGTCGNSVCSYLAGGSPYTNEGTGAFVSAPPPGAFELFMGWSDGSDINAYWAVRGSEFSVQDADIIVTHLGYYDSHGDGLLESHAIGLYDAAGVLLVSLTLPAGQSAELVNGFRYLPLSEPLLLRRNQHYVIAGALGTNNKDNTVSYVTSVTMGSRLVSFVRSRYRSFADPHALGFPAYISNAEDWVSVNLRAIPQPDESNTGAGVDVPVKLDAPLPSGGDTTVVLTYESVDTPGNTSLITSSTGPPPSSGFKLGAPPVYYEIATTATFSGNVRVCVTWTEGQFANEFNVSLFHREESHWVDITDVSSRDVVNNTLCGITASFSPFALMEVKYRFAGFFNPVDNPPVVNSVKAGAAVPVKFGLGGDLGLDIFAPGYPRAELVQCGTGVAVDDIGLTATAGGSTLNYDALTGQYIYVGRPIRRGPAVVVCFE